MAADSASKEGDETKLAVIANDVSYIKEEVKEINKKLCGEYVSKIEFEPVKRIVYGMVALILTAVIGALIGLVILK